MGNEIGAIGSQNIGIGGSGFDSTSYDTETKKKQDNSNIDLGGILNGTKTAYFSSPIKNKPNSIFSSAVRA